VISTEINKEIESAIEMTRQQEEEELRLKMKISENSI